MTETHLLTKSKYLSGLQCVKKLWLSLHAPEKGSSPSRFQETILRRGTEIGERARKKFPRGKMIEAPSFDITGALGRTEEALEEGCSVLFEAAFLFNETFVRADVIAKTDRGRWDIIEVKSTLDVQEIQLPDVAVQRYVLEGTGLPLGRVYIMHLNRACRYPKLENLFVLEDVSEMIGPELEGIEGGIGVLKGIAETDEEPEVRIGDHCTSPYECSFIPYCWAFLPEPSIFDIPRMNKARRTDLISRSIYSPEAIPRDYPLSPGERAQVELYLSGKPEIDTEGIEELFGELVFPLYFLDFETDNPAIPRYPRTGPYEQIPFQYSLHILNKKGEPKHREYLHTDTEDPRPRLARRLIRDIGKRGSVIAYYAPFEKRVIKSLSEYLPDLRENLLAVLPRVWDLLDVFKKHYKDPRFLGSNSLKSVLPIVVPSMTYSGMDVSNGTEAQMAWNTLLSKETGREEADSLKKALLEYCGQDTLAMVEIYRKLKEDQLCRNRR